MGSAVGLERRGAACPQKDGTRGTRGTRHPRHPRRRGDLWLRRRSRGPVEGSTRTLPVDAVDPVGPVAAGRHDSRQLPVRPRLAEHRARTSTGNGRIGSALRRRARHAVIGSAGTRRARSSRANGRRGRHASTREYLLAKTHTTRRRARVSVTPLHRNVEVQDLFARSERLVERDGRRVAEVRLDEEISAALADPVRASVFVRVVVVLANPAGLRDGAGLTVAIANAGTAIPHCTQVPASAAVVGDRLVILRDVLAPTDPGVTVGRVRRTLVVRCGC